MRNEIRKEDSSRYEHENWTWGTARWVDNNKGKEFVNPEGEYQENVYDELIYIHALQGYI